jgi:hypothetical protein
MKQKNHFFFHKWRRTVSQVLIFGLDMLITVTAASTGHAYPARMQKISTPIRVTGLDEFSPFG